LACAAPEGSRALIDRELYLPHEPRSFAGVTPVADGPAG